MITAVHTLVYADDAHHPTAHDLQDSPTAVRHIYALVDNIDS